MNLIIIGKTVGTLLGAATVAVGGFFLSKLFQPATAEIYGFLKVEPTPSSVQQASTGVQSSSQSTSKQDLECQITGFKKFWCSVGEVAELTNDVKKHISLEKLTGSETSTDITGKLEEKKFYKITILLTDFDGPKSESQTSPAITPEWKTIEVFEKGKTTSLGSISALRKIKDSQNTVLGSWKTNMFVGQVSETSTSIANYKCAWSTEATNFKPCKIFLFVEDKKTEPTQSTATIISELSFKKTETEITTADGIKQHHYYLIEFNDAADSKELENFDSTDLIYAKDSSTEKITFSKISAVKVVGEQLLILKEKEKDSN